MSTPSASLPRAKVTTWRNGLFLVFALCGIGFGSWAARVPAVSDALDLAPDQVGLLLFGLAVGSILGLLVAGHLVATFGTRAVMTTGLLVGPVGLALASFGVTTFSSFSIAFLGLAVYGVGISTCDVAMNVSGAANERALGRTVMPIYHAFFSIGTMAGAVISAGAELFDVPLQAHFPILALAIIITALFAMRLVLPETAVADAEAADRAAARGGGEADVAADDHGTWRSRLGIWRDPQTLLIGLLVLEMAFAEGSSSDWLSYAMVHGKDTTETTGAIAFGVFVTAMTLGRLGGVVLLDRFGRVRVLRATIVCAAVGILLLVFVPVLWVAFVGVALWGFGASLGFPVGMSAAADDPRTAAARVSAVATIGYLAFLVGPPVIGFLTAHFGILNALLLVLVLVVLAGVVSGASREPRSAEPRPAEVG